VTVETSIHAASVTLPWTVVSMSAAVFDVSDATRLVWLSVMPPV
jgi:hypothetical protein